MVDRDRRSLSNYSVCEGTLAALLEGKSMSLWSLGGAYPTYCRVLKTPILFILTSLLATTGCNVSDPLSNAQSQLIVAQFDPANGVIPTPNDLLNDDDSGFIHIPDSDEDLADKSAVEVELIGQFNRRAAWSTRTEAKITFSGALNPESIEAGTIQVLKLDDGAYTPVDAIIRGEPEEAPEKLIIVAPGMGWQRGAQYLITVLGGERGLQGMLGEKVVADAAFWFLRQETSLLEHPRALPGLTAEERMENAEKLEKIRLELHPYFEHMNSVGIDRQDIAHLWTFSITNAPEILMDKSLGKMPLPSDFLRSPVTGNVEIPIQEDYEDFKRENLAAINTFDGFGLSSDLYFELTSPISLQTLNADAVKLFAEQVNGELLEIPVEIDSRPGATFIKLRPANGGFLDPDTYHLVVVTKQLQNAAGTPVETMLPGMLAMVKAPLTLDGRSTLAALDHETAAKLELVRSHTAPGLAYLNESGKLASDNVAGAWSFKTMAVREKMLRSRDLSTNLNTATDPVVTEEKSAFQAILDFPIGFASMFNVERVVNGHIMMPSRLNHSTRRNHEDGTWALEPVEFTMTIPRNVDPNEPLKTVIFGHAIVTERRFVYAVADTMARNGYATIGIDFPYHGERTHCASFGPICIENPLSPGDFICPEPCQNGSTCTDDGRCVDNNGEGNHRSAFPILPMYQASGSVFIEIDNLFGTTHHFYQAVSDLNTLHRSLQEGDWKSAIGYDIAPEVGYVGQSLGGIIGSVFTATQPKIARSVLNVPGGNLIPLFQNSPWFEAHFEKFLTDHEIAPGSEDFDLALIIARWIADPVDPQIYAQYLKNENFDTGEAMPDRQVMVQMANFDTIIPNDNTLAISDRGNVPRYDYPASHAFIVIPVEPAYLPGLLDAGRLLTQGIFP